MLATHTLADPVTVARLGRPAVPFALRDYRTAVTGSGTTVTVDKPTTGLTVGDRLLLIGHKAVATGNWSDPSGFTSVVESADGSDRQEMWTRVVDGSEGSNFGITTSSATGLVAACLLFPPCTIEQAVASASTSGNAGIDTGSIGAPSAPGLVVAGCGTSNVADTFTPPSGYTEVLDINSGGSFGALTVALSNSLVSGAPGVLTFTRSAAGIPQRGTTACILVPTP